MPKDNTQSYYLVLLGKHSKTKNHELLLECMDFYNVPSTIDLSVTQLKNFCKRIGII